MKQTQKMAYCIISLTWNVCNRQTHREKHTDKPLPAVERLEEIETAIG